MCADAPSDVDMANEALSQIIGSTFSHVVMWRYGLVLHIGNDYRVTVESPVSIAVGGTVWTGEPGSAEQRLKVVRGDVVSAAVTTGGGLQLAIGDAEICVDADPDYESWQLGDTDGVILVCMPGGGIAVWSR